MITDLIVHSARVLTMDPATPRAAAVAIAGNRIIAVGSNETVLALAGQETRKIDACGATVLPGFVESHLHLFAGAYGETLLQLGGVNGVDRIQAAIRRYALDNPAEALLFAQGFAYAALGDGREMDRHVLDAACPDRPFAVMAYDFHTMFANTAALKAAGLFHGADLPPGNEVVLDENGLATGELREKLAFLPVLDLRSSGGREMLGMSGIEPPETPTAAERSEDIETLKLGLRHAAKHGITAMQNMDGNRYLLDLLSEIETQGALTARIKVPFHLAAEMPLSELDRASDMTRDYYSDKMSCGFVKMFLDGVIDSGTAAMTDDYSTRPGHKGETLFNPDHFIAAATEADKRGMQIACHAIGDAAVHLALNGYSAAQRTNGKRDSRHRIEHIEVVLPEDIPRFAELGVIASVQPPHAPTGPCNLIDSIGPARASYAYAWRRLIETGAAYAFSSDWPIVPISPLAGIQAALTRPPLPGVPEDQRPTLMQAIAGYTSRGAYSGFIEDVTGQLRDGLRADLVLLSGDIESTPPEEIGAMSAALTICDGEITYEA